MAYADPASPRARQAQQRATAKYLAKRRAQKLQEQAAAPISYNPAPLAQVILRWGGNESGSMPGRPNKAQVPGTYFTEMRYT